uniref:NACHT domain-containing protein n=1 Tax=Pseudonaja textilis TaxID=8673 RepID=A0A670XWG4_PSETE
SFPLPIWAVSSCLPLPTRCGPAGIPAESQPPSPSLPGPSANGQLWCIPRHGSNIQMIFTFENAQQPCLPVDAPTCPGEFPRLASHQQPPSELELRTTTAAKPKSSGEEDFGASVPDPLPACPPLLGSVRAFCKRLKEHFRRECRPGPLYLEKDLVQHHLDGRGGRRAALRRCPLGEQGEASVERSRLFQGTRKPGLGSRTILVLGKAGTGKSHLVQKICLDWAEGRMPQFDLVLRFDCRRLSLLQGSCHDFRALLLDSLGGSCQGVDDVYHSLLQKPERLLLLFDGMEDLKEGPEGSSSASGSPAGRGAHRLGATLAPLFQRKGLSGCTFLLTGQRKGRLPPCFPRVDSVLEVVDFSPEQASLCLAGSFEGSSPWEQEANPVGSSPYLLSLCCNPGLCRFIGQAASETRGQELPSTLTGLFATYLLQKAAGCGCQALPALAEVSWSLGQRCQRALLSEQFPSADVKELALRTGLMTEQRGVCVFSNFAAQNFLVALHLTLAKEIKGKKLTKFLGLGAKFRKFLSSWGLVPRFLSGLLFLKDDLSSSLLLGKGGDLGDTENLIARKQRSLSRFIRKLPLRDFRPDKLLELLHCVHETEDQPLRKHLTLELRPDLSFVGFSLAPPDVSVLHAVLGTSPKKFSLDLRGTGIHLDGLRKLVGLKNVTKFRVSLREAVGLWKHLWGAQEREALQAALEKFLVEPFRAKTMGDVDALLALVQLQRDMHPLSPSPPPHLPCSLGPSCGLEGFRKLAGSLVAFSALQHLE